MTDVLDMPTNAFGYVPTPALVAPIEFTMRLSDYEALGGHMNEVRKIESVINGDVRKLGQIDPKSNPNASYNYRWKPDESDDQ